MSCNWCGLPIYVKVRQFLKPATAPMTRVQQLEDEIHNLTGVRTIPLQPKYCPMCGEKYVDDEEEGGAE